MVRLRNINLGPQNFSDHVSLIEVLERTSEDTRDTVLDGHDIG